jgi:hypothetical protein
MEGRYLDHPVVRYLVIGVFSVVASIVLFLVGGSLAEISDNNQTLLGFSFKASGAIGGFFITFWMSLRAIPRLQPQLEPVTMTLYLTGDPQSFSPQDRSYRCEGRVFNRRTGEQRDFELRPRWEAGYLTIDFRGVRPDDLISAQIENDRHSIWEFDYFYPLQQPKTMLTAQRPQTDE